MQGFKSYTNYRKNRQQNSGIASIIRFLVIALVLLFLIQVFAFQTFIVHSDSMVPSFQPGERYVSLVYGVKNPFSGHYLAAYRTPKRGDTAVVNPGYLKSEPPFFHNIDFIIRMISFQKLSLYYTREHISPSVLLRVVGIPGDVISIDGNTAYVVPTGGSKRISEFEASNIQYEIDPGALPEGWNADDPFGTAMEPVLLGENEYFLLADNRLSVADCRYWGVLPKESFQSHILFKFWPLFGGTFKK